MEYPNNTTKSCKHKHLNYEERMIIQLRLKDGFSKYKIAKELSRPINTIINEIRRGTVTQIRQEKKLLNILLIQVKLHISSIVKTVVQGSKDLLMITLLITFALK